MSLNKYRIVAIILLICAGYYYASSTYIRSAPALYYTSGGVTTLTRAEIPAERTYLNNSAELILWLILALGFLFLFIQRTNRLTGVAAFLSGAAGIFCLVMGFIGRFGPYPGEGEQFLLGFAIVVVGGLSLVISYLCVIIGLCVSAFSNNDEGKQ